MDELSGLKWCGLQLGGRLGSGRGGHRPLAFPGSPGRIRAVTAPLGGGWPVLPGGRGQSGAPALGAGPVLAALWSPGEALQLLSLLLHQGRWREPCLTVVPRFTLEPHSLKGHVNMGRLAHTQQMGSPGDRSEWRRGC